MVGISFEAEAAEFLDSVKAVHKVGSAALLNLHQTLFRHRLLSLAIICEGS